MDFRRTANVQSEKMALIAGISTCRKQCSSSLKASRGLPAWPPPSRTCASWKGHEGLSQLWACLVFAFEKLLDTNAQRCCRCGCGCRLHHQVLQVRARPPGLVFVVTRRSHLLAWLAGRWRQYSSHTKYRPKSYFETLLWFRFGGLHFTLTSTILFGKITVLYNRWPTRAHRCPPQGRAFFECLPLLIWRLEENRDASPTKLMRCRWHLCGQRMAYDLPDHFFTLRSERKVQLLSPSDSLGWASSAFCVTAFLLRAF